MSSVLPFHRLVASPGDVPVGEPGLISLLGYECVFHPVLVFAHRVVFTVMPSSALGARSGGNDQGLGHVEQKAEFDVLDELGVEDLAVILDPRFFVPTPEKVQTVEYLQQ